MIVVVLSVTPERLRGELTRWLLEVSSGVYIGHLSARVRERLWARIIEDVGRGRALMVWSARNEQRLAFQVHNHAWDVEDIDGLVLMRRRTAASQELARLTDQASSPKARIEGPKRQVSGPGPESTSSGAAGTLAENEGRAQRGGWSNAGRRRRYRTEVERRRDSREGQQPE